MSEAGVQPTTTYSIHVDSTWQDVSFGESACTVVVAEGQTVLLHIGPAAPLPDTPDYVRVIGPGTGTMRNAIISVSNMVQGGKVWVRADEAPADIKVVRGPAVVSVSNVG